MPFLVRGGIFLDGVQFNTDPGVYQPFVWHKRFSVHPGIGGSVTIQDFGLFAKDMTLKLQSGISRPMEESVVRAMYTRYQTRGGTFSYTDWLNNSFTVFIERFEAVPLVKGRDNSVPAGIQISLYTYEMELRVVTITNFIGQPYTGT